MKSYDVLVLGSGPGGYIAAIRAAQLGKKVGIVERDKLGGVCLNRGCIPTKALLKSAHAAQELEHFKDLGINIGNVSLDGSQAVVRAGRISDRISKGVAFLMKKNKIDVLQGEGVLKTPQTLEVRSPRGHSDTYSFSHCIVATGARYKTFPGLMHDGKNLIGAWEAVKLKPLPSSVGIIGGGAIGVEFAYFWRAFGVRVHLFELQPRLLPLEDEDCSEELSKAYKRYGIEMSLGLEKVAAKSKGKGIVIEAEKGGKVEEHTFDKGLIAVGMVGNIEGIGLEELGVETERGFVKVNSFYQSSQPHIYAIGDVAGPPLLAHAASHEGVIAAEHLVGRSPHPLDKKNIPACTYCHPQVASVGDTERSLKEQGISYRVGKVPFVANGKALASNEKEGFVKVLLGEMGELLGAHIVGACATELIHEYTLFRTMEGIDEEILATVHPHPTLGEWLYEAVAAAKGQSLNY